MYRVINFTSTLNHDIIIIDNIEKEEVYIINRTIEDVVIIKDIKNMTNDVCKAILALAPVGDLEEIKSKLEEPYLSEFTECLEQNYD